ncbi:nucleoside/nucleotide kinase family protein [Agromyces silvae]|uniref:ATP-binding protein n=1 Tax=Agromyces silvae TaxID=3388266 RepID=UPI00280B5864|nr:ATP-binding protein [Agromyces protaetiae]
MSRATDAPGSRDRAGFALRTVRCLRDSPASAARGASTVRGRRLVAIDGPSGAGKSTLADAMVAAWPGPVALVRLDEVYPGWHGLDRGAALIADSVVAPWARGAVARVRCWDWRADAPGPIRAIAPGLDLVIEGCGAFDAVSGASALRIWVHAGEAERRRAALTRDRGAFDPYWDMWDAQWRRHAARTGASAAGADLIVRGLST